MITANAVAVSGTAVQLGPFTNADVTISNVNVSTDIVYLGGSGVSATNGFPLAGGSPPLALGRVTGTLYALGSSSFTIGLLVTSPE